MAGRAETLITELLNQCDIAVGGPSPWDVHIHDERLFDRVMLQGTLGLGEAYMDGWWDAEALDQALFRLIDHDVRNRIKIDLGLMLSLVRGRLLNLQRLNKDEVGRKHYDLGNDLFEAMLDPLMIYSCGYWREADDLAGAQRAKLDLICRKAGLKPGDRVLDIGCGWGGFLGYAAENYGITGMGITISKQQVAYAQERYKDAPLDFRLVDYADVDGRFDKIISVGMFEHVGYKNYNAYFEKVAELLRDDGLFVLHTIGGNQSTSHGDPWTEKYIFPNSMLPSIKQIAAAAEDDFVMEDWHNFGADYDHTLMAWHANFEAAWPTIKDNYDERFHRMWRYYLLMSAALFRARSTQLWQIVFAKNGVPGGYPSIR
ncbi:cyclopropane fatty acyl phospholipid synthase [Cucumibacter marinus]|uniref:cyclopropane fatty acyl phospholipid synthase n=1 Tax=Cucumibacter marinus TaxID=1121252 RepID=UPI00041C849C|nr:cyclopropane fatty acyl phospholipid synthase [Cucumibacter marinus]